MKIILICLTLTISVLSAQESKGLLFKFKNNKRGFSTFSHLVTKEVAGISVFNPLTKSREGKLSVRELNQLRDEMLQSGEFEFVELDTIEREIGHEIHSDKDITLYDELTKQWHHNNVRSFDAWSESQGEGVVVAVCDSGIDYSHEDLAENIIEGWNFVGDNNDASAATTHGTFVAGVIGAVEGNNVGGVGVAPKVSLMPLRITSTSGSTSMSTIVECIQYAADHGAKVINVSFTGVEKASVNAAGEYANERGALLVYAAGNQGKNRSWKDSPYVVAVGGTKDNDYLWRYRSCRICRRRGTNAGDFVDLVAPAQYLYSTGPYSGRFEGNSKYFSASGTSFAAPVVSGVAALIFAKNPELTPREVEQILEESADVVGSGNEYYYGAGRVNAVNAVEFN